MRVAVRLGFRHLSRIFWTSALALSTEGCTPLQIAAGTDWSRAGVRPRIEARLGYEELVWSDPGSHDALWLGPMGAVGLTASGAEGLTGPELQFSRARGARSLKPSVDVLFVRPEVGWPLYRSESRPSFWGASLGGIREFAGVPMTAALRLGNNVRGPESGFSMGLSIGIVAGSSLYWMQ